MNILLHFCSVNQIAINLKRTESISQIVLLRGDDHCLKSVVAYLSMLDMNNIKAINKCQPHPHKSETEDIVFVHTIYTKSQALTSQPSANDKGMKVQGSNSNAYISESSKKKQPTFRCLTCVQTGHISAICPTHTV